MKMFEVARRLAPATLGLAVLLVAGMTSEAEARSKAQVYLLRMEPQGQDAERFSRAAWGGGINGVISSPAVANMLSAVGGVEYTNLLSRTTQFQDPTTGLRVEQQTNQSYFRVYVGPRLGPQGRGFVRPHAGANLALVVYNISTDVVVPDDVNRENEIRQHLHDETKAAFGYDFTVGVDWNIVDRFPIETGVRFLRSFNVPQQLGAGAVTIAPEYFQIYLGVGLNSPH
jgi:opacity protein-like surface antigen